MRKCECKWRTRTQVVVVRCTYKGEVQQRLRLCAPDDGMLSGLPSQGPLNQVLCFEYCDGGTLLSAAYDGAFRRCVRACVRACVRVA